MVWNIFSQCGTFKSSETTRREKYAENNAENSWLVGNVEYSNVFVVFWLEWFLNSHFTRPEMSVGANI